MVKSDPESKPGTPVPDSTLEKRVQDLISLICDIKTMEQAVVEMEYDAEKAPLGKITTEQVSTYFILFSFSSQRTHLIFFEYSNITSFRELNLLFFNIKIWCNRT